MRGLLKTAATTLFSGAVIVSASAQEFGGDTVTTTAPVFYAPFPWYGNALDQKIIDAQAQMLVPRHLRQIAHRHYRRAHR